MTEIELARQTWRVGFERAWIDAHREQFRREFVGPPSPRVSSDPMWWRRDASGELRNGLGSYNEMTFGS